MKTEHNLKKQLSNITYLLFAVFLVFSLNSCSEEGTTKDDGVTQDNSLSTNGGSIKLGAFIQKSANSDVAVKSFQQGVQLALDSNPSLFEVDYFDVTEGNSETASKLKSLIEKNKSPAMLYWSVDDIVTVAPYLTQSNTIGIISWDVTKKVAHLGANIYGFGYSNELSFKQLAKFAGNTLKSYRFGIVRVSDPKFDIQSKTFIEETKSLGNTVVFDETVDAASADFVSLVKRAQKENCDTIFATLPAPALIQLIKTAKSILYKGKILVGDTLFYSDVTSLGQDIEDVYMVQSWSDDAELKALYATKYGLTPDGVTLGAAALGYDTVRCLQDVGTNFDASSIKYSFLSKSCEGLSGKTQFTGERIAQRRKKILALKKGELLLAE